MDKYGQNSISYDIKGEEMTLKTPANKEKARDGYVHIYEFGKHLINWTYECACGAQDISISQIK